MEDWTKIYVGSTKTTPSNQLSKTYIYFKENPK